MTEQIRTNAILNDRYLVQKELGQGGMGAVYLAQDMQNRRTVAIKVARLPGPEARAQFQREADYLQRLHHHSLPRVWDYFSDTQRDFLVMEYIPGEDLETLVHRKGPQPEWLVLRWTDELLEGLEYLHSQNPPIIHRDVKPGNLKLRQDETLVLVDFGIAKEFLPGTDTSPGANAITPGFSPLEQYSDIVTDARTDIYSVGATMYFLLTARIPPPAPDRASGDKKLLPPSQLVPDTTAGTEMVTRKALSLPRDERWANASEMRSALAQASQQRAARETPPKTSSFKIPGAPPPSLTPASAPEGTGKRPAGCIALVALAAVALLAVAALLWSSGILKPGGATAEPSNQITVQATAAPAVAQRATLPPTPPPATAPPTVAKLTTQPTATLEPSSTPAGAENGAEIPTSTPISTRTPTPAARTATAIPTPTLAKKTIVATLAPTATSRAGATNTSLTVALTEPGAGAAGGGDRIFRWQAASLPPANQAFELVFWKPGQDAMNDGFGLAGTTQSSQAQVNLDVLDDALPQLEPGDYLWGVLLVEPSPYRRLGLISNSLAFRYERSSPQGPEPGEPPGPTEPPP